MPKRPITYNDIAKKAGCSAKTVSLVVSRSAKGVSPDTKAKIKEAIAFFDYKPKERTSRQQSKVLGLCVPDLEQEHYGSLAHNIITAASARGGIVLPFSTNDTQVDEEKAVRIFRRFNVSAVILTSSRIEETSIQQMEKDGILVVSIGSRSHVEESDAFISINHEEGMLEATHYLIQNGHRRIAYLSGPRNSQSNKDKLKGYEKALGEANIPINGGLIIEQDTTRFDYKVGEDSCEELINRAKNRGKEAWPTAIVCYNDELALGAVAYLRKEKIDVPEKVSVIGYDGIKFGQFCYPPLSTVSLPRLLIAQTAVRMVYADEKQLRQIKSDLKKEPIKPKLTLRGSSGPAPVPDEDK